MRCIWEDPGEVRELGGGVELLGDIYRLSVFASQGSWERLGGGQLLIHPSASSPYPCRKINVAGDEEPVEGASIRWGGF